MIVAFTGAGISQPSGIPTFEEMPELQEALTAERWHKDPSVVWDTVRKMLEMVQTAEPNPAHKALAEYGIPVVTQNIDGLHQKAGSKTVIELHGNINEAFCVRCGQRFQGIRPNSSTICTCGGWIKPSVILYGEDVNNYWRAFDLLAEATTVLVVGTRMKVAPACNLISKAERNGAEIVIINSHAEREVLKFLQRRAQKNG